MGEKTNNGIHYRLQLLYSNGESFFFFFFFNNNKKKKKQWVNNMIKKTEETHN